MSTWVAQYAPLELFCLWTKFTKFLLTNVEGVAVDQVFFRSSICRSVQEIFGIKVESCRKSRQNLDVFLVLPNCRGQAFQKLYAYYHPASRHVVWRSFVKIFRPAPKLLRRIRWILGPIFNFHDKNFFGGPLSQLGCALGSLGQSLAFIKIWGGSTP